MIFVAHDGDAAYQYVAKDVQTRVKEVVEDLQSDYPSTKKRLSKMTILLGEFHHEVRMEGFTLELRVYYVNSLSYPSLYNLLYSLSI